LLYWPEFEFDFRLDVQRLLPHIAAIEAYKEAASNSVLPPQWREEPALTSTLLSASGDAAVSSDGLPEQQRPMSEPIDQRKQQLWMRNASASQAWVRERFVPGSAPLTLADILSMHRMVADESGVKDNNGGVLRTLGVQVGRREVGGVHAGAPPGRLPHLMDQYVRFVNDNRWRSFAPAVHALVAHFFFTTIHPFDDGNGRVSRLVSAAILFQRGYNGHGFYALSNYFYQNDIKYHSLLHQCWQQPLPFNLTAFVAFGMEGLAIELQGVNNFIKMKLNRIVERDMVPRAFNTRRVGARGRRPLALAHPGGRPSSLKPRGGFNSLE
jgi:cell filamentation protein, protein adenylyltransferase